MQDLHLVKISDQVGCALEHVFFQPKQSPQIGVVTVPDLPRRVPGIIRIAFDDGVDSLREQLRDGESPGDLEQGLCDPGFTVVPARAHGERKRIHFDIELAVHLGYLAPNGL